MCLQHVWCLSHRPRCQTCPRLLGRLSDTQRGGYKSCVRAAPRICLQNVVFRCMPTSTVMGSPGRIIAIPGCPVVYVRQRTSCSSRCDVFLAVCQQNSNRADGLRAEIAGDRTSRAGGSGLYGRPPALNMRRVCQTDTSRTAGLVPNHQRGRSRPRPARMP